MFCKYCGKKIHDDAEFCIYCMKSTDKGLEKEKGTQVSNERKTGIGFLLGLFLGFLGLIIGLGLYPFGTTERRSFLDGWCAAFLLSIFF